MTEPIEIPTKTISLAVYEALVEGERVLNRLYAAGVDNWEGYDYAMELGDE